MRNPSKTTTNGRLALGLALLLLLPAGLAGAAPAGRITGTIGDAESDDQSLALRGSVDDGADLETGTDGGCSLLVDEDMVMEVCGDTLLRLERKNGDPDGARVVRLDRGNIRMVVEPRLGAEKVEIHTPAAIATVLGTILHASVNALGVAEITSEANRVRIASTNPSKPETKIIDAGQTITIAVDGTLGDVVDLSPDELRARGGCFDDLHKIALYADSSRANGSKIEEMVNNTVEEVGAPDVGSPGEGGFEGPAIAPPVETQLPPEVVNEPMIDMDTGCPPGIPGETCF